MKSILQKIIAITITLGFLLGQVSPGWAVPIQHRDPQQVNPVIRLPNPNDFLDVNAAQNNTHNIQEKDNKDRQKPRPVAPNLQAVENLVKQLGSTNPGEAQAAEKELIKIGEQAIPALKKALNDENMEVRTRAAEVLNEIHIKQIIPLALEALKSDDKDFRELAKKDLIEMGASAVPELIAALKDSKIRSEVMEILTAIYKKDKLTKIAEQTVPALMETLKNQDKGLLVRRIAASNLAKIGSAAVPALVEALQDKDSSVRYFATCALSEIDDKRAVPILIDVFKKNKNKSVRYHVAEALGEIGDERAIPALTEAVLEDKDLYNIKPSTEELLEDINDDVWDVAAEALVKIGKPGVSTLIDTLKDKNKGVRYVAAWALGKIGDEKAVSALIKASKDADADVRRMTVYALGIIGDEQAIPALIEALQDKDWKVCSVAAFALGSIGGEKAVPVLINILKKRKGRRDYVALALGYIGDKRALPALIDALEDSDIRVRAGAAMALGQIALVLDEIGRKIAIRALIEAAPKIDTAFKCVEILFCSFNVKTLRDLGSAAVPALVEALKDKDSNIRFTAAEVLGSIRNEQAIPALIEALGDKDQRVRETAACSLCYIGNAAVSALIDALKENKNKDVRCKAAWALGKIGDKQAIPTLIEALKDKDADVRIHAAYALCIMGEGAKVTVSALIETLSYYNNDFARDAMKDLVKIGGAAVPALIDALKNKNRHVRRYAAEILGIIGDKRAVPALIGVLKEDKSLYVRYYAAEALGKIGDKAAVPGLMGALKDKDENVRYRAKYALGKIGDKRAIPIFIEALKIKDKFEDKFKRIHAAWALGKIGDKQAVPALTDALKDEDVDVREAAAQALDKIKEYLNKK